MAAWHCGDTGGVSCGQSSPKGGTGQSGLGGGVPSTAPGGGRRRRVPPRTGGARFTASLTPTWPGVSGLPGAGLAPEWLLSPPPVNGAGPDGGVVAQQQSVSGTCHSGIPTPAPSTPAHLLRNVPLQPLRRHQHEVRLAPAVPSIRVAQVEGVSGQDKLQGAAQADRLSPPPALTPSQQHPALGLSPPRGAL